MIQILLYNDLDYGKLKKQIDKVIGFLKAGDFKSADVKKMLNTGYYRAKLDDTNRLLFKYAEIANQKYLLVLEIIHNHAYDKSRFLNGAQIDETKLPKVENAAELVAEEVSTVTYLNDKRKTFNILDKIISFDEIQEEVFQMHPPLIVIGSAGSGKTALTLEKVKTLNGRVLYITLSSYLVENSQNLYYSFDYRNEKQEIDFLSFQDYLGSIEVPKGKELDYRTFEQWIWRFKQSHKVKDTYKVYEEFKGVLTGSMIDKPYLTQADYIGLGVKQSIFLAEERVLIYDLFTRYLDFLKEGNYYDSNLIAYDYLARITPSYDYIVVDEVQDITNVQLFSILKSMHIATNFLLCGDSNQIVHPNFFSWTNIKTLFYNQDLKGNIMRILATNYRNTPEVTHIANQLLRIKNTRFGSIDRESTYLVKSNSQHKGDVQFLENSQKTKQDLNQRTRKSAKFAVIVMRNEDKDEARRYFNTPLLFSIQEVKGLEYENIILYNIISSHEKEFREITIGVTKEDLETDLVYSRAKDKTDKSLDEYKFYINSLYVAMTRAIKNLYVVETNKKHALLELLGLTNFSSQVNIKEQVSTTQDWQKEARKLEMQGKTEQADAIRQNILQLKPVPWTVVTNEMLKELELKAFDSVNYNKKQKDLTYEYALFYGIRSLMDKLSQHKYRPADDGRWQKERQGVLNRNFGAYISDNIKILMPSIEKYGLDFRNEVNLTPFMNAITNGSVKIASYLVENGAKTELRDNYGHTAIQISFLQAFLYPKYKTNLNTFYPMFKGESLTLKIKNRSFKIANHQAEYFMLNFMISNLSNIFNKQISSYNDLPTFKTQPFLDFYENLTTQVIPEYRTKRSYISSILSKNEATTDNKYSKKLWVRYEIGHYILNPLLEIKIEDNWVNVYNNIDIEQQKKDTNNSPHTTPSQLIRSRFLNKVLHIKQILIDGNDEALNKLGEEIVENKVTTQVLISE